jgi:anti-sigma B factor antagonist
MVIGFFRNATSRFRGVCNVPDPADVLAPHLILRTFPQDDAIVVQCIGQLVAGLTGTLAAEVKPLIRRTNRIILDLSALTRMDSLGLWTIISQYVSAKAAGCDLKLISLGKRIYELFRIAKLSALFELYGEYPG